MKSVLKKIVLTVITASLAALTLIACGQPADTSITDIRNANVLKVGIPNYDTDLLYYDNESSSFRGVEAEIADVFSQGIQVPVQYVELSKDEMLNSLNAGAIDVAIGYIDINSSAIANYGKTISYGGEDLYLVTPRGIYAGSLKVFQSKSVGVSDLIDKAAYEAVYSNGVVNVFTYDNSQNVVSALRNQDIAGYICYKSEAQYLASSGEFQVQSCNDLKREEFTVVMLPNRTELINGCNSLIGEYLEGVTTPTWITNANEEDKKNNVNAESLFGN